MKKIFIASTGQNVGKTTLSLGMMHLFQEHFPRLTYMKPVGQEFIRLTEKMHVDKDVALLQKQYNLTADPALMSPVLIPSGFTKDFLDGHIDSSLLKKKVVDAYNALAKDFDVAVIEGTGHLGVGSILDLNNAQVAHLLKAPILLICPGGLGSSFDELSLNLALCEKYKAHIAGVILNKVKPEKQAMISHYMRIALQKHGIPLLGSIPYSSLLSSPSMRDLALLFGEELLTGHQFAFRHFEAIRVISGTANRFSGYLHASQLFITSATREDIVSELLSHYLLKQKEHEEAVSIGLILTGEIPPSFTLIEKLKAAEIPILYVPHSTQATLKSIHDFHAKIQKEDTEKIEGAIQLVKESIDLSHLMRVIG